MSIKHDTLGAEGNQGETVNSSRRNLIRVYTRKSKSSSLRRGQDGQTGSRLNISVQIRKKDRGTESSVDGDSDDQKNNQVRKPKEMKQIGLFGNASNDDESEDSGKNLEAKAEDIRKLFAESNRGRQALINQPLATTVPSKDSAPIVV